MSKHTRALVVFAGEAPSDAASRYDEILSGDALAALVDAGSIYEASVLVEELSKLSGADGKSISKGFLYRGYELWWIHYHDLYQYFCLPYTRYQRLLNRLRDFEEVTLQGAPYESLFFCFLKAYGVEVGAIHVGHSQTSYRLPFGIMLQICLDVLFLPLLIWRRPKTLLFTGDKFADGKDYDFRMKFIYEELRARRLPFVEFVRSLEPWKKLLQHVGVRRRAVIYPEGVAFVGRVLGALTGGHRKAWGMFGNEQALPGEDPFQLFKRIVAVQYLLGVYDDVWAIRIMRMILRATGIKAAIITTANERNFHTVLACKMLNIPSVGILHGAASKDYNVYDFMPGFSGEKSLPVDVYGVWSEWWREYYVSHSKAYASHQIVVSGPFRPLKIDTVLDKPIKVGDIKVLFVPGELSDPRESLFYIESLMEEEGISFFLTFRPYRDRFENWIKEHNPGLIERIGKDHILLGDINSAIAQSDVVVGSYSTAVLEAVLQDKPFVFFNTRKWGDYFSLREYDDGSFFAEDPPELAGKIKKVYQTESKVLADLRNRFFGDPTKNGSAWVVDRLEEMLGEKS